MHSNTAIAIVMSVCAICWAAAMIFGLDGHQSLVVEHDRALINGQCFIAVDAPADALEATKQWCASARK